MALPIYTVIDPSATQANAPLTTDLAQDWTNNTEHVRQTVYDPAIHVPTIAHDHNGVNSALVDVPFSLALSIVLWEGIGGGLSVIVNHAPSNKDLGIILCYPAPDSVSTVLFFKTVSVADEAAGMRMLNSTRIVPHDGSTDPSNTHLLHLLGPSALNLSGTRYSGYLLSEIEGFLAIGQYVGDGINDRLVDISSTSHSGQPDFQPDLVIVWRTDASEDPRIRTVDHGINTCSNFESGTLITNGIRAFNANGFTVGVGNSNTSGGEYKYLAVKIGKGNGISVERIISPQDSTEQFVDYVSTIGYPFMAIAIETTGPSPTLGVHFGSAFPRVSGGGQQMLGRQIDVGTETDTGGIRQLQKTRLQVGTSFPNSNLANISNSNIWIFRASPAAIINHGLAT